jgi:hypothetical protein
VPDAARTARYLCAAALAWPDGREAVRTGTCEGVIVREPRGSGGFGYDPLFYLAAEGGTFGELPAERKHALSHRVEARARHPAGAGIVGTVGGGIRGWTGRKPRRGRSGDEWGFGTSTSTAATHRRTLSRRSGVDALRAFA